LPAVRALAGSAEQIPLPDGALDAVLVAQAWHWVDVDTAVPEVARVLAWCVERAREIRSELLARGLTAGTFQHEVDHLDGVLFLDRVSDPRSFTTWDQFERFHREEFERHARELVERYGS